MDLDSGRDDDLGNAQRGEISFILLSSLISTSSVLKDDVRSEIFTEKANSRKT
jgi:hypothetical protein